MLKEGNLFIASSRSPRSQEYLPTVYDFADVMTITYQTQQILNNYNHAENDINSLNSHASSRSQCSICQEFNTQSLSVG
jgi:hypothetical protein